MFYQLIFVDMYEAKTNLVFGSMEALNKYATEKKILSGEKVIKSLKINVLTEEEFNELAK